jgi:hypothetical protein
MIYVIVLNIGIFVILGLELIEARRMLRKTLDALEHSTVVMRAANEYINKSLKTKP